MKTEAERKLFEDVLRVARDNPNTPRYIDALLDQGIDTCPSAAYPMTFTLTYRRGEVSMCHPHLDPQIHGTVSASACTSHYRPILRYLELAHARGEPQERILDEAGEVRIAIPSDELLPGIDSNVHKGILHAVRQGENCGDKAFEWIDVACDYLTPLSEEALRKKLKAPVCQEIEELGEPHRLAAIRWACRSQSIVHPDIDPETAQAFALRRQEVLMRASGGDFSTEPVETFQP